MSETKGPIIEQNKAVSSSDEYLQSIIKFIPVTVLYYLSNTPQEQRQLPHCQTFKSAVMVAEIKNFYNQDKRLKNYKSDQAFNEDLSKKSAKFLDIMSTHVHRHGGDVIQFLGNSLIALWPRRSLSGLDNILTEEDTDKAIGIRATQCGIDIKQDVKRTIMRTHDEDFEIHIGIGFGDCGILHVGGVFRRVEYVLIGDGLSTALRALRLATIDQSLIISWNLWNMVDSHFVCEPLNSSFLENEKHVLYEFGVTQQTQKNTIHIRQELENEKLKAIQMDLKTYIPAAYRSFLKYKRDTYGNQHRHVTVMALNLEMEYDLHSMPIFTIIQKIITIVQQQVYRMEGSFNKVISYDGGVTVLCSWGLNPMSHEDDATRAVIAALNIQKRINYFTKVIAGLDIDPPIHIGIASGHAFMGILGEKTSSKKEIVMLGETIERAFLYMQTATKFYGKIFVDYETKMEASQYMDFKYIEHVEFTHKYLNQPIFEPVDPSIDEWTNPKYSTKDILKLIRIHSNPFKVDYRNEYQHKFSSSYGSKEVISQILEDISAYTLQSDDSVWTLAIKGLSGSGKSLFARSLLQQAMEKENQLLREKNEILLDELGGDEVFRFHFMVSTCNAEIAKRFIGVWIPIIREILREYSRYLKKKSEIVLNNLIKGSEVEDKIRIIEDIFGIKGLNKIRKQMVIKDDPYFFVKIGGYPQSVEEDILYFINDFIGKAIETLKKERMFFITFDNVSIIDKASWRLFDLITQENDNLIIIMCIQSQNVESPSNGFNFKIADNAYKVYKDRIADQEREIFNVVEMEALTEINLREVLIDLAEQYQLDMQKEIRDTTNMINPDHSFKTLYGQEVIKNQLVKKFQVYDYFQDVEKDIITEIVKKCNGIPLHCISMAYQLLTNEFIQIREQLLLATNKLRQCFKTKCWNDISLPSYLLKANCGIIENSFLGREKYNKLPRDMSMQAYQLIKVASIVGDIFSKGQIIYAFYYEDINNYDIELLLEELEQRGVIEFIYEDSSKDTFYRFINTFMRETLFQVQIYETQRKPIHSKIIGYLQENMIYNWQTDWNFETEQMILLQNLLAEQGVQFEKQLNLKGRQALIIKRINAALMKQQYQIKYGSLLYHKSKPKASGQIRYLALTENSLIWYLNEADFKKEKQKGSVYLDQIIKITQATISGNKIHQASSTSINLNEISQAQEENPKQFSFQIICNEWSKNGLLKKKQRKLIFTSKSKREGQDWICHIEYLRTKVNLDKFKNKFGNIKFPIDEKIQNAETQKANSKISQKPDSKFGQYLQRQIAVSQQQNKLPRNQTLNKSTFSIITTSTNQRRNHRRHKLHITTDEEEKTQISNLKDQMLDLYTILKLHYTNHLAVNACKYNQDEDDVICSDLNHIDKNLEGAQVISEKYKVEVLQIEEPEEEEEEVIIETGLQESMDNETYEEEQEKEEMEDKVDLTDQNLEQSQMMNQNFVNTARRLTYYDPHDPNGFKMLQNSRGFNFPRKTTIRGFQGFNRSRLSDSLMNENPDITFEDTLNEALFYYLEDSPYIKLKPIAIPMNDFQFQEGQIILEIKSHKDQANLNYLNIKRRKKNYKNVGMELSDSLINEEVFISQNAKQKSNNKNIVSIDKQLKHTKNNKKEEKIHSIAKVLEQSQRTQNNRGSRNKIKANNNAIEKIKRNKQEKQGGQILEQRANDYSNERENLVSNPSVAYLQTMNELQNNKKTSKIPKSKNRQSKIMNKQLKKSQSKVYKAIPSLKDLQNWIEKEEPIRKIQFSDYDDNDNDSDVFKPEEQQFQLQDKDEIFQDNDYQENEEVMIIKDTVQCIVLNPQILKRELILSKGDIITVQKDLKELNLVQCLVKVQKNQAIVVIPRDSIHRLGNQQQLNNSIDYVDIHYNDGIVPRIPRATNINSLQDISIQASPVRNNKKENTLQQVSIVRDQEASPFHMSNHQRSQSQNVPSQPRTSDPKPANNKLHQQQMSNYEKALSQIDTTSNHLTTKNHGHQELQVQIPMQTPLSSQNQPTEYDTSSNQGSSPKKDSQLKIKERREKKMKMLAGKTIEQAIVQNTVKEAVGLKILERKKRKQQQQTQELTKLNTEGDIY